MTGVQQRQISKDEDGLRIDRWFRKHFPTLSHGRLEKLLRQGLVRLDGKRVKANARLSAGSRVRVPPEAHQAKQARTEGANRAGGLRQAELAPLVKNLQEAILHQDDDVIVLNKPSGLAVQGGSKTKAHIDAALPGLQFGADEPPRLVHRLDRDTSGLLLLARNRKAAQFLTRQFAGRDVEKIYWALVYGVPRPARGHILVPLAKRAARDGGECVRPVDKSDPDAMSAHTDYAEIARIGQRFSWLAFRPKTGSTHQIRAHADAIGHPLVGDGKYRLEGEGQEYGGILPKKLHLHARSIMIPHPSGGILRCDAPLRDHMASSWDILGLDLNDADNPFAEDEA